MSLKTTAPEVKKFWEDNPLCRHEIPYEMGSPEYFSHFDGLRADVEPISFSKKLYEFEKFKDKKVLEVGCGNGYVLSRYAQAGADVYGIDITQTGVDLSQKRLAHMGLSGQFVVGSAEELPYPDNHFDCVCSMGVLHHVPNTEKGVSEIFRVLKPHGYLIVMFYHRNSFLYRFKFPLLSMLTGKTMQTLVNEVDGVGNPKGDIYSRSELRQLLSSFTQLDLMVRSLQGWMLLPKLGKYIPTAWLRPLERLGGWFLYAKGFKPAQN